MELKICILYSIILCTVNAYVEIVVPDSKKVFDADLYENVLDSEQCQEQMRIVFNNAMLLAEFLDAGPRIPRGILKGNLVDLGNYYQCLEIDTNVENTDIQGKYCRISVPAEQDINWPSLPNWPEVIWPNVTLPENITWPELPWAEMSSYTSRLSKETKKQLRKQNILKTEFQIMMGVADYENNERSEDPQLSGGVFHLALCIPKPCTSREALNNLIGGFDELGLQYTEEFCRLPNDKKWVPADYTAIAVFSCIILLTVLSTSYDLRQSVILKRDPKSVNKLYQSFSLFTNTRRLLTFNKVPNALECLDGVRSFAMMWVIIGHTFVNQLSGNMANPADALNWMVSYRALWITAAPITVDTFFMISGLLVVYATAGKMSRGKFIRNLHLFYLNRLLRLFPVLAAVILLQASFFNRITDGPSWENIARQTEICRVYWWTSLLYIQNFVNPATMCLGHSWYLAIDFQMFLLSPLILFWVISGRRRAAWLALATGLVASLIGSSVYNFINDFASSTFPFSRMQDQPRYIHYYYVNTLTRCSPFFVGMIYGYLLHLYKGKKIVISKVYVGVLWILALIIISAVVYTTHPIVQVDWDNQLADNIINSFIRPVWALGVGWIVFACSKGYGGPINWLLSLSMWKLLARLSYAMYIIHYPLIFIVNGTPIAPVHFSVEFSIHKFTTDFSLAVFSAFVVTVFVDSPCSTLIKMFIGGGPRRPQAVKQPEDQQVDTNGNIDVVISSYSKDINKTAL